MKWSPATATPDPADAAGIGWKDFIANPKVAALVEQALAGSRDLHVAEVANAWLAPAADSEQLRLVSALDLAQARTVVETARADMARHEGQVAADRNALVLLVGGPIEPSLLPSGWEGSVSSWKGVPAGLTSELLLRRPDVRSAEHSLRAANANIGAARAAFFPSITLAGSAGAAADELSGLFKSGTFVWSVVPQVNVPIFQDGRLTAGLEVAADRDIALARCGKSIPSGFREVADAPALSATRADQRRALESTAEPANWITLYKDLGGDWREAQP